MLGGLYGGNMNFYIQKGGKKNITFISIKNGLGKVLFSFLCVLNGGAALNLFMSRQYRVKIAVRIQKKQAREE